MWPILLDALLLCTLVVGSAVGVLGLLLSYLVAKGRKGRWAGWLTLLTLASWALLMVLFCPIISSFVTVMNPRNPTREDLIGTWVPTESSLEQMSATGYKFSTHTLEFSEDGTFVMTNFPDAWVNGTREPKGSLYSTRGTWDIVSRANAWKVNVRNDSVTPTAFPGVIQFDWIPSSHRLYVTQYNGKTASFEKCGKPRFRMSDEILKPLAAAIGNVDRESLGFTPIPSDARVDIAETIGDTDVWLHVYADTSRTIMFKREGTSYRWIYEQETHTGPEHWTDHDGATWQESITVDFQTEPINGIPINKVVIGYTGHDSRLLRRPFELTLEDIQPILGEWKQWRLQQIPSPVSFCP